MMLPAKAEGLVSKDVSILNQSLIQKVLPYIQSSGDKTTAIEGLFFHRRDWNYRHESRFFPPTISVVVQGRRSCFLGEDEYEYRFKEGECIVLSTDVPCIDYTTQATPEKPFLSIALLIDRHLTAQLVSEIFSTPATKENDLQNISSHDVDIHVLEAFDRLVDLLDKPDDIPFLAPLIIKEIHYRILMGQQGNFLRQANTLGTQSNQIACAILWLREHFREPLFVEELAHQVNMAPSTFYRQFKAITHTSPIQFQKKLRLHEAQRLMLVEKKYVTTAALSVGYENPKQFSREYKRFFGRSPSADIRKSVIAKDSPIKTSDMSFSH